jgi:beta-glucosidase
MAAMSHVFRKDFLWGASTAAHQVEGDAHNQWSEWERANAQRLAATAHHRLLSVAKKYLGWDVAWEDVKAVAENPENYISGNGVEHYRRYKEDFALLKGLNMNAFRFSIEWSRIEPEEGKWDAEEIEHYRQYIAELKRLGIEPVVTLWHWTMPVWFTGKGGFEKRQNIRYFERFVAKVADELGGELTYVIPLNEPNVYVFASYLIGQWPPERRNVALGLRVYHNLMIAHRRMYLVLKHRYPHIQVGIATALGDVQPAAPRNPFSHFAAGTMAYIQNWWFLDRIRGTLDFVGVNYYMTSYITWRGRAQYPPSPKSDAGWYMEPAGIGRILTATWQRYRRPIIITENGLADAQDKYRKWWLEETIAAMRRALASGVDLRGYLHWSLLDNFEWAFGWWPKFGLVAVDRKTMKRTIRPSARWLAGQIKRES